MKFHILPEFNGSRAAGYAAQKNFLRTKFNPYGEGRRAFSRLGERYWHDYVEPGDRWDKELLRELTSPTTIMDQRILALGVERNPPLRTQVKVVLAELENVEDWEEFKKAYKTLLLGYTYSPPRTDAKRPMFGLDSR